MLKGTAYMTPQLRAPRAAASSPPAGSAVGRGIQKMAGQRASVSTMRAHSSASMIHRAAPPLLLPPPLVRQQRRAAVAVRFQSPGAAAAVEVEEEQEYIRLPLDATEVCLLVLCGFWVCSCRCVVLR